MTTDGAVQDRFDRPIPTAASIVGQRFGEAQSLPLERPPPSYSVGQLEPLARRNRPSHPLQKIRQTRPACFLRTSVLLFVSVVICCIDRSNLSVVVPLLKNELGLAVSKVGVLPSAFFCTYALFQLIAGWLVDRCNVSWVLVAGFFLWSVSTAATGFAGSFGSLLLMRLLLGMGVSAAYPAYGTCGRDDAHACVQGLHPRRTTIA
jgi:hypothetical protein